MEEGLSTFLRPFCFLLPHDKRRTGFRSSFDIKHHKAKWFDTKTEAYSCTTFDQEPYCPGVNATRGPLRASFSSRMSLDVLSVQTSRAMAPPVWQGVFS